MANPTLQQIIDATGGKLARDGQSVVMSYGNNGFLRLFPDQVIVNGAEIPAVRIEGKLMSRNGGIQSELRAKIRANGLEIR